MIKRLSKAHIDSVYQWLINGNEDVRFHCTRLREQNREAAVNSPWKFGLKLLGNNVIYRIPGYRNRTIAELGRTRLSPYFQRGRVHSFAAQMLHHDRVYFDVMDSLLVFPQNVAETEPELLKKSCIKNSYLARTAEIVRYNHIPTCAVADTPCSGSVLNAVLRRMGMYFDEVFTTGDAGCGKTELLKRLVRGENPAAVSGDFQNFLRPALACGCRIYCYYSDRFICERLKSPLPEGEFLKIYVHVLGSGLMNDSRAEQPEYEYAYLYLAPLVYSAAWQLVSDSAHPVFRCGGGEEDFFSMLLETVFGASCDASSGAEIQPYFYQKFSEYMGLYGLLTGAAPMTGKIVQTAVLEYCQCFHRFSRHMEIDSEELERCGRLLFLTAAEMLSPMLKKGDGI